MGIIFFRKTTISVVALILVMCEVVIAQETNESDITSDTTAGKKIVKQSDIKPLAQQEDSKSSLSNEKSFDLQKFDVTGTHIKRVDFEGPSPVLIIDRDEIDISGASTVNDLLSKLTMNNGLLLNENRTQGTSSGAAGINLRGLGQDGTLVLVNGRRFTSYPFAFNVSDSFVDLNSIPLSAVEKVEVLKDGASALYGSDAIAGVVNIILRKNFEHSEISEGFGVSEHGDANETDINYITGKSTDKSNLTFALNYYKRESFLLGERDFSSQANQTFKHPTDGLDWTTIDNDPANYFDGGTSDPACFGLTVCSGFFNPNPYISAIPETERLGGLFTYNREILTDLSFFTEVMLSQITSEYQSAPTPIQGDIVMGASSNNPINPTPIQLFWRVTDAGPRQDEVVSDTYRVVAGFEGVVNDWDWTAAIHRSASDTKETGNNYISLSAMNTAINSDVINPFGVNQPDVMETVKRTIQRIGESTTQGIDGKIVGELSQLESGPITLAVGMDYRNEAISDIPDASVVSGDIIGKTGTSVDEDRNIIAGFAEVNIPVSNDVELQVAARIENYSDFGTTANPKLAVKYKPTEKLLFRASAGTGFKAPSLPQLYSQTIAYKQLFDTNRFNTCMALFSDPNLCGGASSGPFEVNLSGNKDLEPEDSKSIYLGIVYEPAKNIIIGLDYWRYTQENIIEDNTQYVLDNESQFPGSVNRGVAQFPGDPGPISSINDTFRNYAEQNTDGMDLELLFTWQTSFGEVSFRNVTSKLLGFEYQAVAGGSTENLEGTYRNPELRNTMTVTLNKKSYSVALIGNYIDEYKDAWNGTIDNHVVNSLTTYNLQYVYKAVKDMSFTAGINNLTDKEPPFSNADYLSYDSSLHNPIGRFYYLRVNHQF